MAKRFIVIELADDAKEIDYMIDINEAMYHLQYTRKIVEWTWDVDVRETPNDR